MPAGSGMVGSLQIRLRCFAGLGMSMDMGGMHVRTRDHCSVTYRVPVEWAGMTGELREAGSLASFKRRSRAGFEGEYGSFVCMVRECAVCGGVMHSLAVLVPISGSVSLNWTGIFADEQASYEDYGRLVLMAVTCYWTE